MTTPVCRERALLLGPLDALDAAVDRARVELGRRGETVDDVRREQLELAAADVLRALVGTRRQMREREHVAVQVLGELALLVGAAKLDALGVTGRVAGVGHG